MIPKKPGCYERKDRQGPIHVYRGQWAMLYWSDIVTDRNRPVVDDGQWVDEDAPRCVYCGGSHKCSCVPVTSGPVTEEAM